MLHMVSEFNATLLDPVKCNTSTANQMGMTGTITFIQGSEQFNLWAKEQLLMTEKMTSRVRT